jgi:hypothetical protein
LRKLFNQPGLSDEIRREQRTAFARTYYGKAGVDLLTLKDPLAAAGSWARAIALDPSYLARIPLALALIGRNLATRAWRRAA